MKKLSLILLINLVFYTANAQNTPRNPKVGKCYVRQFYLDKKIEWKEIDCKLKGKLKRKSCITDKLIIEHKKMLLSKGYKVDTTTTSITDESFIQAHNDFIHKKEKVIRKRKRLLKKYRKKQKREQKKAAKIKPDSN